MANSILEEKKIRYLHVGIGFPFSSVVEQKNTDLFYKFKYKIYSKLPPSGCWKTLQSGEWKQRRQEVAKVTV